MAWALRESDAAWQRYLDAGVSTCDALDQLYGFAQALPGGEAAAFRAALEALEELRAAEGEHAQRAVQALHGVLCERRAESADPRTFKAVAPGSEWLKVAARLAARDGHAMRLPGGLKLAPAAFDGVRLRAQVLATPHGDVLRLTLEASARLVVQSLPGRFAEVDAAAFPSRRAAGLAPSPGPSGPAP
ncbi:MAG: hypothetical protein QM788_13405 [Roseateles sp.]|uniref:hypothetical protein n=1 Tax=Roseateles sp. TaxID=1971397 RepID=UPI0039EBD9CC